MPGLASQHPPGEDWITRDLGAIRREADEKIAAGITGLVGTVRRIEQTTGVTSSTQNVPYEGPGSAYQVTGPDWATHAMCVSAAALVSKTVNGMGRIALLHSAAPITLWRDYGGTLDIGVGSFPDDFVVQGYPYLVALGTDRVLHTRPWAVTVGASAGSTTLTFTTVVTWIAA